MTFEKAFLIVLVLFLLVLIAWFIFLMKAKRATGPKVLVKAPPQPKWLTVSNTTDLGCRQQRVSSGKPMFQTRTVQIGNTRVKESYWPEPRDRAEPD